MISTHIYFAQLDLTQLSALTIHSQKRLNLTKMIFFCFKIFFPTGTKVGVVKRVYHWYDLYIDVKIEPSPKDVGKTTGLCGNLNGRHDEDIGMSKSSYYMSWK